MAHRDWALSNLAEALVQHELVLIVGSNLAFLAGLPGWADLVRSMSETGDELPDSDDEITVSHLLRVLGRFEDRKHELIRKVCEKFDASRGRPTKCHYLIAEIARLSSSTVFTTYYDDLIERALDDLEVPYGCIIQEEDIALLGADRIPVVRLIGNCNRRRSLVITASEFRTYSEQKSYLSELLYGSLRAKTGLLIGCRLHEPFMQIFDPIWDRIITRLDSMHRFSHAVMFDISKLDQEDLSKRGIEVTQLLLENEQSKESALVAWLEALLSRAKAIKAGPATSQEGFPITISTGWLPDMFKYPPFPGSRTETDPYLSSLFWETPDFERFRDPATGTVFVFAGRGQGKTAMARMLHESCRSTLSASVSSCRIMTVLFTQFEYFAYLSHSERNPAIHVQQLLTSVASNLYNVIEEFPHLKKSLHREDFANLDQFLQHCMNRFVATASDHEPLDIVHLFRECQRISYYIKKLGIDYTYILIDRVDEFGLDDEAVMDFVAALLNPPTLLDLFQFKFFLSSKYQVVLMKKQDLNWRLEQIRKYHVQWQDSNLKDMLAARLENATEKRVYSFTSGLMEWPGFSPLFDVDQLMVKYAYGSPRDLVYLADAVIREHMNAGMGAERSLIAPSTLEKALRAFAWKRAEELYGEDLIGRIVQIRRYPLSLEMLFRTMEKQTRIEDAQAKKLIREESGSRGKLRYTIPDPRVRLCCPACAEDQVVFSDR